MRKKELIKKLEKENNKLREEIDCWEAKYRENKFDNVPEMDIDNCAICGAKRIAKDMIKYKARSSVDNGWYIYYICKKCLRVHMRKESIGDFSQEIKYD